MSFKFYLIFFKFYFSTIPNAQFYFLESRLFMLFYIWYLLGLRSIVISFQQVSVLFNIVRIHAVCNVLIYNGVYKKNSEYKCISGSLMCKGLLGLVSLIIGYLCIATAYSTNNVLTILLTIYLFYFRFLWAQSFPSLTFYCYNILLSCTQRSSLQC